MNPHKNTPSRASVTPPDVISILGAQRHRIAELSRESGALQLHGRFLLAESNSLAERVQQSCARLESACLKTKTAVARLRLRRSGKNGGTPVSPKTVTERLLTDSPDLVEALAEAAQILEMEFADTDGSGHETLVKCEKALQRTRLTQTIELPLF